VTVTKGITIYGNGQDATVINANSTLLFSVTLTSADDFRIHDLGFTGTGGSDGLENSVLIRLGGVEGRTIWNSLRADHLKFTNIAVHAFTIGSWWDIPYHPKALFDNITFTSNRSSRLIKIAGNNSTWRETDQYGTDYAIFIEDSTFTWTGGANGDVMDTEHGARLVVRHNTITNGDIQMHDTGSTQGARGQRITEIYNNTLTCTDATNCGNMPGMGLRGGGYIVHDNTITGRYFAAAWPQVWRATVGSGYLGAACNGAALRACNTSTFYHCSGGDHAACSFPGDSACSGKGSCVIACTSNSDCPTGTDGTATCLTSIDNVDGGRDLSGYPCRDQTGWGQEYSTGGRLQYPSPVYWYNNKDQNEKDLTIPSVASHFQQDRDYCYHSPATACGTKTGWTYTPYTYPHPLQAGAGLQPPTNLRMVPQ
jgi:hypothetical protein